MACALLQCYIACACLQLCDGTSAVWVQTAVQSRQGAWGLWAPGELQVSSSRGRTSLHAAEHTDQFFVSIQIKHLFSWRTKYITAAVWLSTGLGCCTPAAPWHLCNGLQSGKNEVTKNYSQELNLKFLMLVKPPTAGNKCISTSCRVIRQEGRMWG